MIKTFNRLPAILSSALFLIVTLNLAPSTLYQVYAQTTPEAFNLSVSPPVAYLQVKPGETLKHTISIHHQGTVPLKITPQLVAFQADKSGQGVTLDTEGSFPYLTPDSQTSLSETFTLQPGQKRNVLFQADPPNGTLEREYHLTVLFSGEAEQPSDPAVGAQVTGTIGSNIIVAINNTGLNRGQLKIKDLKAPTFIDSFQDLQFSVMAENTGTMASPATGSATITNWQNNLVANFELYPDMVLAQSPRLLRPAEPATASGDTSSEPPASTSFTYGSLFLIGPYQVQVTLGNESISAESVTKTVIALPFSLILLLLGSIGLYFGFGYVKTKLPLGSLFKTY